MGFCNNEGLYYVGTESSEPEQITGQLLDTDDKTDKAAYAGYIAGQITYITKNHKTIFYPEHINTQKETFTLYKKMVDSNNPQKERIEDGVLSYMISEDGSVVTCLKKEGNTLYQISVGKKEKVAEQVERFLVSKDGNIIIYIDNAGSLYKKIKGKEIEKICDLVTDVYTAPDMTRVYYLSKGNLYTKTDSRDQELIGSAVDKIYQFYDTNEMYYRKKSKEQVAGETYELYYCDGKKETMLTNKLVYNQDGSKAFTSIAKDKPVAVYGTEENVYITQRDKISTLDHNDVQNIVISDDGSLFYYLDSPFSGILYKVQITDKEKQTSVEFDTEVNSIGSLLSGNQILYYKKEYTRDASSEPKLDMYVSKQMIGENVLQYSYFEFDPDLKKLYFYTIDENQDLTLNVSDGRNVKKVAEKIILYEPLDRNRLLYLCNYKEEEFAGELYVYSKGEVKRIEEKATFLFSIQESHTHWAISPFDVYHEKEIQ